MALTIGRLAQASGVGVQALRYYERVWARLADLRRMDRVLEKLVVSCERRQAMATCPILTALDDEESEG